MGAARGATPEGAAMGLLDEPGPAGSERRPRLALAEDDGDFRHLLAVRLRLEGLQVDEYATGEELLAGLTRLQDEGAPHALVISDLRMPKGTGLDVLRRVRGWGWTTPWILITAFGDEAVRRESERAGTSLLLSKPFDLDDLIATVRTVLPRPGLAASPAGS